MELYVYDTETLRVLAIIEGNTNEECERKAEAFGYRGCDGIGWTYSPSLDTVDGLLDSEDSEII
ncbi:MAG: hypothetical protein P4L42_14270 [Desulfocapsaceae bacterium]|nr:hypothetical protein [Desulfocapsaceae bacterium]